MCAKLFHLVSFLLMVGPLAAQDKDTLANKQKAGEYALVAYGGLGLSVYSHTPETPSYLNADPTQIGFMSTFRVMWHPDHLLRLGIETGHTNFYNYTFADEAGVKGSVDVSAVPLLLVWSMPIKKRFNAFIGYGYYRITSDLDYITNTKTSTWSLGYMAAVSYVQPLSKDLGLGCELKWMNAKETANTAFSAQVQLQWKFLRW